MRARFIVTMLFFGLVLIGLVIGIGGTIAFTSLAPKEKEVVFVELPSSFPAEYVGEFGFTHYCDCPICTGSKKGSKTATGHKPRKGRTIAVDPKIIPLHSIVYIEGIGYFVAEDVGGGVKGNHIDIYVDDHNEALKLGTLGGKKRKVWIMKQTHTK